MILSRGVQAMMFSNRRFNRLATFFIGSNRLWAAQLYHH